MSLAIADLSLRSALDDEAVILLGPRDFSSYFVQPSHNVRVAVDSMQGRCGTLIVVQMRGGHHANESQQASLRSLGLGKMRRASLRMDDAVTRGFLQSVRHLIAVVELDGPCYKEGISDLFESHQFGTQTRPGEICRSFDGQYIGFQADRRELSLYMSTTANFIDVFLRLAGCGLETELSSKETWVSVLDEAGPRSTRGYFTNVVEFIGNSSVRRATLPVRTHGRASRDSVNATVMWRADIERFSDIARTCNEVAIMGNSDCFPLLGSFKSAFAEDRVRERKLLTVHAKGKRGKIETIL